ncbi:MAG: DUF3592 domain-containing protein [Croceivirga sp.]
MTWWLLFYGLLFSLGFFLAYLSYGQLYKTKELLRSGIRTKATVHSFKTHNSDGTTMYTPTFTFKDKNLEEHFYESKVSSHPRPYDLGEKVNIIYGRKNPKNVKILSFWGLYAAPVILFMVASPLLILGGAYLAYRLY